MIGTLMKNTEPNQKRSSRKPLVMGPMLTPAPAKPAQMAMAVARSRGGNTLVTIDSVAGMIMAAPTPMTALVAIRCQGTVAWLLARAARAKMARPPWRRPLRPKRSPRAPMGSTRPAKTRE